MGQIDFETARMIIVTPGISGDILAAFPTAVRQPARE
jgi:hypothetical protein